MAPSDAERRRSKAKSREAYRREYEEKRAKRLVGTVKVQPFDPVKFAEQVHIQSWSTIHVVIYASVVTAAFILIGRAAGYQAAGGFAAILMIGTVYYYLVRVWGLDIREVGRPMAVVGVYLTYFVSWLMMSFLITNPPFIDDAPPEIHEVTAYVRDVNGTWVASPLTGANATYNQTARLDFWVVDSSPIARVTFEYRPPPPGQPVPAFDLHPEAPGRYSYTFTNVTLVDRQSYFFTIHAWDSHGRHTEYSASLSTSYA